MNIRRRIGLIAPALCAIALGGLAASASAQAEWVIKETPNPGASKEFGLAGVSCTSAFFCQAIGSYEQSAEVKTLADRWNGVSWLIQSTPELPELSHHAHLSGVVCLTTTFCEATGTYEASAWKGLAEVWNGSSWSFQKSPNHIEGGSTANELARVSCTTTTACEAVGWYTSGGKLLEPLAEGWNGTEWKLQKVVGVGGSLHGVSCTSATSCEAVGSLGESVLPFATHWNGSSWASQTTPNPEGAKSAQLNGVSCTSASACEATGFYVNASGVEVALAERWDGTAWKIQSLPTREGAKLTTLDDVSCPTAESCRAAGHYQNSAGVNVTLVEKWNGSTWAVESTPNPEGAKGSLLHGISCWSATACASTGEYTNISGEKVSLAESL